MQLLGRLFFFCLHPRLVEFVAPILLAMIGPLLRKDRNRIMINACHVLKMNEGEARRFARAVFKSQFLNYVDTFRFIFARNQIQIDLNDFHRFHSTYAGKWPEEGVVAITAHIGSWELAGHFAGLACGKKMHVLAKENRIALVNVIVEKLRQRLDMEVLWIHLPSLMKDMMRALMAGHCVGFVMDQRPAQRQSGIPVTFLGIDETHMVQGPALMISKKQTLTFGCYCLRTGPAKFKVIVQEIVPRSHGLTDQVEITNRLKANMESIIRSYPEQWAWNYKRWQFKV
jgi:lauroyl/myristoyl acyltransferase